MILKKSREGVDDRSFFCILSMNHIRNKTKIKFKISNFTDDR